MCKKVVTSLTSMLPLWPFVTLLDKIIFGDWDITQDGGGCANVKTAIDNLVTGVNSIIVPTDNDYAIGAD